MSNPMQAPFGIVMNQKPTRVNAVTFIAALMLTTTAWPQSSSDSKKTKIIPVVTSAGPLDGRQFNAKIVRADADEEGRKRPLGDKLTFREGTFSSAICEKFNFAKAPYWVRVEGNQIHFLAELTSPTAGTMRWKGTVRGDTLEGTMRWKKKRWYWTIDVEHKIRGKLIGGLSTASPLPN